ncbi:hypothetical protein ACFQL9_13055 [Halobaculum lipolyticum]|uniref:DUF2207 domain-containing protein n=1 Tax=Halobaculum lipolyticum TaxID=3032001 RepID=A0ABD5WDK1_9EURY
MARTSGARRRSYAVIAVALIVGMAVLAPAAAAATGTSSSGSTVAPQQSDEGVNTSTVSSPDYTYEELSATAAHPSGAPPSIRPSGSYGEYAIKYLPTGLFSFEGFERYAGRGTTIERTSFQFWSKRPYQTASNPIPDKQVTVHTVLWKKGTATVSENNRTQQVPIATNITETKHSLTLGPGYTTAEIPLPREWDSSYRLTVFVGSESDTARWQFTYNPSKVAKTVPAQSEGTRTLFLAGLFALAGLAAGVSLKGSQRLLRYAGAGPQISLFIWGLLVIPGSFVVFFVLGWDWTVQQLVTAPWLFPVLLGILVGFVSAVLFGDFTFTDLFVRLKLEDNIPNVVPKDTPSRGELSDGPAGREVVDVDAEDIRTMADGGALPSGTPGRMQAAIDSFEAQLSDPRKRPGHQRQAGVSQELSLGNIPGVISADVVPMTMTRYRDGSVGPVRRGLFAFLARAKGAASRLRTDGNPHNRIEVDKGPYQNLYFVDPQYDDVLDHESESWRFEFPALVSTELDENGEPYRHVNWKAILGTPTALTLGGIFGRFALDNAPLGVGVMLAWLVWHYVLTPSDGKAYTELAPIHYDRVVEVVMSHASALSEVTSLEDSWTGWIDSETRRRTERRRLADERDKTQSERISGEFLASEYGDEDFNADSGRRGRDRDSSGGDHQ